MRRSALRVAGSAKPLGRAATSVSSSSARSFATVRDPAAKVGMKLSDNYFFLPPENGY